MAYQKVSLRHCDESPYKVTCSACRAPAGFLCASKNGRPMRGRVHRKRRPVNRERLPDLRLWWRSVARFEGEHAKPRPAGLVVP